MNDHKSLKYIIIILLSGFLFTQCKSEDKKKDKGDKEIKNDYINSDTYDFTAPKIIKLPPALDEISGIAYYAKDTSVFAIIDEDGILYKIPLLNPKAIKEWVFDKPRDFEDLFLHDSLFYVLISNGDLNILSFKGGSIKTEKIDFPNASKKTNEFEAMYFDSASNKIVLMCKSCEQDSKTQLTSFYLNDSVKEYLPLTTLDTDAITGKNKDGEKERIKPSAAAVHPLTGELYVLCSVNKIVFITDSSGKITEVIKLNPKIYRQPEGMCFTPEGNLIISNELGDGAHAELLLLKNKKNEKND